MGKGPLRHGLLTHCLRAAYAELTRIYDTKPEKKKHDSKYHEILQASIWSKPKHDKLREILEKVAVTTFWLSNSYHHQRKGSSDTVIQSGNTAYAKAYALYFAKVAYATLRNPVFCLRDPVI